ncbi:MAG: hypothetical protein K8R92_05435 [Planctomycetes bacterium]|nr:hypothetical protein [Planctomycetota bacterium]
MTATLATETFGDITRAISALAIGSIAFGLASFSLTRQAAKLLRIPVAAALIGGGWVAFAAGLLLGPIGFDLFKTGSLTELRPLLQLGLAWIGLLVGLQLKRSVLAAVPAALWQWLALDSLLSLAAGVGFTATALRLMDPGASLGAMWIPCALTGCATMGWAGELRSLRGLDTRSPQLATLIHAGAGLAAVLAIALHGVAMLQASTLADGTTVIDAARGSLGLVVTLIVAAIAATAIRVILDRESWSEGRIIASLVGTLALVSGVSIALNGSPMFGACLLGMVITNMRSGAMRRLERLVTESEAAVASMFFLFAGAMLGDLGSFWPWIIAAALITFRFAFKTPVAWRLSGKAWNEPGAQVIHFAAIRQAPIAIPLAIASLVEGANDTQRGILLALVACGVLSNLFPLLWRSRS